MKIITGRQKLYKNFRHFALKAVFLVSVCFVFTCIMGMADNNIVASSKGAEKNISKGNVSNESVDSFLSGLKSAYESRNLEAIMGYVDKDFPAQIGFKSNIDDYFLRINTVEILFYRDSFLVDRNKVLLRLHWFKRAQTRSGNIVKNQGNSEFGLVNTQAGLKLLYINKDNPFY